MQAVLKSLKVVGRIPIDLIVLFATCTEAISFGIRRALSPFTLFTRTPELISMKDVESKLDAMNDATFLFLSDHKAQINGEFHARNVSFDTRLARTEKLGKKLEEDFQKQRKFQNRNRRRDNPNVKPESTEVTPC